MIPIGNLPSGGALTTRVCETQMPLAATKLKIWQICKSYILIKSNLQGHVMSVKCDQTLDELAVQV